MSHRHSQYSPNCLRSRRSLLSVVGVSIAIPAMIFPNASLAEQPVSTVEQPGETQTAIQRVISPISSQSIRLEPISTEFERTLVSAIATDPRGELIAVAGDDHAIRILDASTMRVIQTLQGHTDLIRTLDFDSQGDRLVSAGNDGQLILWNRNAAFGVQQRMQGTPALARVSFSPDGKELGAVGFGSDIYLIGRHSGDRQPTLDCDCNDLRALAYRGDGKLLAVSGRNGELSLFESATGKSIGQFKIHSGRVHELVFVDSSPVVVSVGADGNVCLFDTDAKRIVQQINVTGGKLFSVAILDSDHLAVAGSDNLIRIVNMPLGRVVEKLTGHTGSISSLDSDGSLLFSGGYDATLRRWQLSGIRQDRERIADRDQKIDR